MTIAMGRAGANRGVFDVVDDWLKRDRFVFVGWSGLLLFPCAFMALAAGSLAPPLLRPGTPMDSRLPTSKALTSSPWPFPPPLTAWGTPSCCSGVPKPKAISFAGAKSAVSGLRRTPRCLRSDWIHAPSV